MIKGLLRDERARFLAVGAFNTAFAYGLFCIVGSPSGSRAGNGCSSTS